MLVEPTGVIDVFAPSSAVPATKLPVEVRLRLRKPTRPRKLVVSLVGHETRYKSDPCGALPYDMVFEQIRHTLLINELLSEGAEHVWRADLMTPEDICPTSRGSLVNIWWVIRAELDLPRRGDLVRETSITVLTPRRAQAHSKMSLSTGSSKVGVPDRRTLLGFGASVEVKEQGVKGGTTVNGTIRVAAAETSLVDGARVELVRLEIAKDSQQRTDVIQTEQVLGQTVLSEGTNTSFDFVLQLSGNAAPTAITRNSSLRWFVRGVFMLGSDTPLAAAAELRVFNV